MDELTLNVTDAAKRIGIPRSTFDRDVKGGLLHEDCVLVRPGGELRIRMKELAKHHPGLFTAAQIKTITISTTVTTVTENERTGD